MVPKILAVSVSGRIKTALSEPVNDKDNLFLFEYFAWEK